MMKKFSRNFSILNFIGILQNMSKKKKIMFSIITVVLNNRKTIERCIKSVLSQKFQNFEYIVVDGGSNDGTWEILEKYKKKV